MIKQPPPRPSANAGLVGGGCCCSCGFPSTGVEGTRTKKTHCALCMIPLLGRGGSGGRKLDQKRTHDPSLPGPSCCCHPLARQGIGMGRRGVGGGKHGWQRSEKRRLVPSGPLQRAQAHPLQARPDQTKHSFEGCTIQAGSASNEEGRENPEFLTGWFRPAASQSGKGTQRAGRGYGHGGGGGLSNETFAGSRRRNPLFPAAAVSAAAVARWDAAETFRPGQGQARNTD